MRAAVCRVHGPPERVQLEDVKPPVAGSGEVRVQVSAAAVNFADVLIVGNDYQIKVATPFVPGSEFAGVIDAVGAGVTDLTPGDHVFATVLVGAFAEHVTVPSTSASRVPAGVNDDIAATFGVAHRTAYHVLRSVARVQAGDELVVLGAGGGVGLATVQLGNLLGASVTAVASSPEKLKAAAANGARALVNYRDGDLREALRNTLPAGADVVIDPVGGELADKTLRSLRWGGRFVTVGYASGVVPKIALNLVLLKGVHVLGFELQGFAVNAPNEFRRNEAELMELLASNRVAPHIGARFALDEVVTAMRFVADGRAVGKVLLDVS